MAASVTCGLIAEYREQLRIPTLARVREYETMEEERYGLSWWQGVDDRGGGVRTPWKYVGGSENVLTPHPKYHILSFKSVVG